jgi:hypothetical protein
LFELLRIDEVAGAPFPALSFTSLPPFTLGTTTGALFSSLRRFFVD